MPVQKVIVPKGEGHVAQEAGESVDSPAESLTTTVPSGPPEEARGPHPSAHGGRDLPSALAG